MRTKSGCQFQNGTLMRNPLTLVRILLRRFPPPRRLRTTSAIAFASRVAEIFLICRGHICRVVTPTRNVAFVRNPVYDAVTLFMPRLIEVTKQRGSASFARLLRIKGVDVNVHWSVFVIAGIMLLNAGRQPVITLVAVVCYMGLLLLHETGHLIAAQRRGSRVLEIRLYPILGKCMFETPWSRFDHCIIAWGGVLAQFVVAVPLVLLSDFFGPTRFQAINTVVGILGWYSIFVAIFNLLPIPRFDGSIAWYIIPEYWRRRKRPKAKSAWR